MTDVGRMGVQELVGKVLARLDMLGPMADSTPAAAQEPVQDPWEGFASAHTWISTRHSWWHLIPQPIDADAPADSAARLGFDSPCHVLTAYNPGGRAAAEVDNRAADLRWCRADPPGADRVDDVPLRRAAAGLPAGTRPAGRCLQLSGLPEVLHVVLGQPG
jgi:hypothetical protein